MALPFLFPYPQPLVEGRLLRRYHRFLADIELADGAVVVAHCVNPGVMEGMIRRGNRVWLSPATGAKRKLRWTWELTEVENRLIGTNTVAPNFLVRALLEARALDGLPAFETFSWEKRYGDGNSRVDFQLDTAAGPHLIEVKNCHLVYPDGGAYFPDSVSERATKHLEHLSVEVRRGVSTTVLFTVQRDDATHVRPSDLHDPTFAKAARAAAEVGVQFRALLIEPTLEGLWVRKEIPVDLAPYDTTPLTPWKTAGKILGGWERPPKAVSISTPKKKRRPATTDLR